MADRDYAYDRVSSGAAVGQAYMMEQGQSWRQYAIAGIANLGIVAVGYAMVWTSPVNIKLTTEYATQSPLDRPITTSESAWIGSLLSIGAIIGPFIGGLLATKIGRKWGMLASSLPLLVGWILVAAATNVGMMYAARICWGISVGMLFAISPMYCAEIASTDSRGALGSFLQLFVTVGFLILYGIGPYITYSAIAYAGVATVVVFDICFFFMPESPFYYLLKNDRESAAGCLATIRGKSRAGIQEELDQMAADVLAAQEKKATIKDLAERGNVKAMYISCALVFFQQLCGINAVLFYMTDIFVASGSSLDSSIATIIIGAVQVGASGITPMVVDRLGRRLLLLISSVGTAIGLGLLGMYFFLAETNRSVAETISFIPVLSLVLFILTYCWGLGPLPWAVMGELFPLEVKAIAAPIATAMCWALSFLVTRFFSPIADALGMYVAFWIFGVFCVLSFLFTMFFVPETKGKSFAEIQDMLRGRSPSKNYKA